MRSHGPAWRVKPCCDVEFTGVQSCSGIFLMVIHVHLCLFEVSIKRVTKRRWSVLLFLPHSTRVVYVRPLKVPLRLKTESFRRLWRQSWSIPTPPSSHAAMPAGSIEWLWRFWFLRVEGLQVALEVKLLLKRSRNSRGRGERQEISRR
jgi:hypothetical protein